MDMIFPPPPNHAFLLTPALGYANVPINLVIYEGKGIYRRVAEPFADDFDGKVSSVLTFLSTLRERVTVSG